MQEFNSYRYKKILKIFLIGVIIILLFPLTTFLLLQIDSVQNFVAKKVVESFSDKIKTKITLDALSFAFSGKIAIKNLCIYDEKNDTAIFVQRTTIDIEKYLIKKNKIIVDKCELSNAKIALEKDSAKLNIQNLIDWISKSDTITNKKSWTILIDDLGIKNSRFSYFDHNLKKEGERSFLNEFSLNNINIRIKKINIGKEEVSCNIKLLSFMDKSKFEVKKFTTKINVDKNSLELNDLSLYTNKSNFKASTIKLIYTDIKNLVNNFNKLYIETNIKTSKIFFKDIGYFYEPLKNKDDYVEFSFVSKGILSDIRFRDVTIKTGRATVFKGNIAVTGIPNFNDSYYFIDAKELTILYNDIEEYINQLGNKEIKNKSDFFKKLGYVSFKGNFNGFLNDFVTFGTVNNDLGKINLDILLRPKSKNNVEFNGEIDISDLKIGEILDIGNLINDVSLNLIINGSINENKKINSNLNGFISKISIKDYLLKNISTKGTITNNVFSGNTSIHDSLIYIDVSGIFDFNKEHPSYEFISDIRSINLMALKIIPKDSINSLSCNIKANFRNNSINEMDGQISIKDLKLSKYHKSFKINNIDIIALNNDTFKKTIINSDIGDIVLHGKYNFKTLLTEFNEVYNSFINFKKDNGTFKTQNYFDFDMYFKNINEIADFFNIPIHSDNNLTLKGVFHPIDTVIRISIISSKIDYRSSVFDDPLISLTINPDSFKIKITSSHVNLFSNIDINNVVGSYLLLNDSGLIYTSWHDSSKNLSQLKMHTYYDRSQDNGYSSFILDIDSSKIYLYDSIWTVNKAKIIVDSSKTYFSNVELTTSAKSIKINGVLGDEHDTLICQLNNIELVFLNSFLQSQNFKFKGRLFGNIYYTDFKNRNKLAFEAKINRFAINDEPFGTVILSSFWERNNESVKINLKTSDESETKLDCSGGYYLKNKGLDFVFDFNNVGLKTLQPVLKDVFLIKNGTAEGQLKLTGTLKQPILNGDGRLNNGILFFGLLNVDYSFTCPLYINNSNFIFKDATIYDEVNKPFLLNGIITSTHLKNYNLDFSIRVTNNLVFKNSNISNLPFYGVGYASGNIRVLLQSSITKIDIINAQTEKNTNTFIPVGQKYQLVKNDYIVFKDKKVKELAISENKINTEDKVNNLLLNIDLNVTPDALITILFDPLQGDILKGQGSGNLKFVIDNAGNFSLRGDYNIEGGEYYFTMRNLINKKFIIQENSRIMFNGNPADAVIDVLALYRTRAPLYNIVLSQNSSFRQRIPVDCQLFLNGKLLNPDIRLGLDFPTATEETKNQIRTVINNEQELSQQFMALLILNNFLPSNNNSSNESQAGNTMGIDMATTTSFEILSSQLSTWVSQISKDVNLGINYRPGYENLSPQEIELALSTQLFNDKVLISSNIDFMDNQYGYIKNNSNTVLLGDFNIEYKLSDKVSIKAFNRTNDIMYFQDEIYTKGVGITYKKEFSNFKELKNSFAVKKKVNSSTNNNLKTDTVN